MTTNTNEPKIVQDLLKTLHNDYRFEITANNEQEEWYLRIKEMLLEAWTDGYATGYSDNNRI